MTMTIVTRAPGVSSWAINTHELARMAGAGSAGNWCLIGVTSACGNRGLPALRRCGGDAGIVSQANGNAADVHPVSATAAQSA
jgi:hypothetical protein